MRIMAFSQDAIEVRKEKLVRINALGINPYPHHYSPNATSRFLREQYEAGSLDKEKRYDIAGRLMAWRDHRKIIFGEVQDHEGRIQVCFEKEQFHGSQAELLSLIDLGDIVGVSGNVFQTRRGEITLHGKEYALLTKTLLPLPEKWNGIKDLELKYRRRSEYATMNLEMRDVFTKRSRGISAMREFLDAKGFLEVETPLLQPVYGGASAKPFKTHINVIDTDYFLSISPELYLKRYIAAGFNRVYTICKNFRNEGIDRTHNPEFTMMECYQSYADYNDMMKLTEEMYAFIFEQVLGSMKVMYRDPESDKGEMEINFTPPWKREKMLDLVHEYAGIDVAHFNQKGLQERILAIEDETFFRKTVPRDDINKWSWGELVGALFSHYCENQLIQPTFVVDHPRESTPLCKIHREDPRLIERFEPFVYGWEIGNAYSELNDPVLQRSLLEEQVKNRVNDDIPEQIDEDFCRAIEFGIPPTGGLGLGIDRLTMFLTNSYTIKDVIFFPLLRKEEK